MGVNSGIGDFVFSWNNSINNSTVFNYIVASSMKSSLGVERIEYLFISV